MAQAKLLNLTCTACGNEFQRRQRLMENRPKPDNVYCSHACCRGSNKGGERVNYPGRGQKYKPGGNHKLFKCRQCKKEFYRYKKLINESGNQYCSKECCNEYWRAHPTPPAHKESTCKQCSETYKFYSRHPTRKGKYRSKDFCSAECQRSHNHPTINCEGCGKSFVKRKARIEDLKRRGVKLYCSTKCGRKALSGPREPYGRNPDKWMTLTCEGCGEEYERLKKLKRPKKNACSRECRAKIGNGDRGGTITLICDSCGECYQQYRCMPIPKKKSCSKECRTKLGYGGRETLSKINMDAVFEAISPFLNKE